MDIQEEIEDVLIALNLNFRFSFGNRYSRAYQKMRNDNY